MSAEQFRHSQKPDFDPRKRETLKVIGQTLILGAAVAFSAKLAYEGLKERKRGEDKLLGQPIEREIGAQYMTVNYSGDLEIPLRPQPDMGGEVGVTLPDFRVEAQPVYGVTYPSNSIEGNFADVGGRSYGRWYLIEAVPMFAKAKNGEYVPIGVARGVYISGNFLTRIKETANNEASER